MDTLAAARESPWQRLCLRIRTSWGWAHLDREIAAGASLEKSDARSMRADELLRPEERRAIAAVLRNVLDAAEASSLSKRGSQRNGAASMMAFRVGLEQLIDLLRSDAPMTARAVAQAELLACDPHSPLRRPHGAQPIVQALREITDANAP